MLADNLAVVVVKLKGVAGLGQLAFKIISKKAECAIQGDVGYTLELRAEAGMNPASKAWANRRIWIGCSTERSSGSINERSVSASAKAQCSWNAASAGCGDGIGDRGRIKLRLSFAEIGEAQFIDSGGADSPRMAGVDLLRMSDNPAGEITQRTACQLEDGERIQRVVIIVIIIEREFLVRVQDLVEAKLELVRAIRGFNDVLGLGTAASRPRQELHQAGRNGIKALRGDHATRKDVTVQLWRARRYRVQIGLASRGEVCPASRPILEDVGNRRVV